MKKVIGIVFSCLVSFNSAAEPVLSTIEQINFRSFLPMTGSCQMDINTALVYDINGSRMCSHNNTGNLGRYRIIATPNKIVDFRVLQRTPQDSDGITYTPLGTFVSDTQSINITPNAWLQIDSGSSGNIDITLGGQIYLNKKVASGSSFIIEVTDGIEFTERP